MLDTDLVLQPQQYYGKILQHHQIWVKLIVPLSNLGKQEKIYPVFIKS